MPVTSPIAQTRVTGAHAAVHGPGTGVLQLVPHRGHAPRASRRLRPHRLFRRIKHDFDPTLAEVRAAWEATATLA